MVQHVKNIVRIAILLVGIVLRKKVLELNEFFEEKLSQTGII